MLLHKDLARYMNEKSDAYHIYEYDDMLKVFVKALQELTMKGEVIQLRGLGTFYPHATPERKVYNFQTQQTEIAKPSYILKFKPALTLVRKIRAEVKAEREAKGEKNETT